MSVRPRWARASGPGVLAKHMVGNALVVHSPGRISSEAQLLAMSLAADDEYGLVVVDVPVESPIMVWESVAALLPRQRQGLRLVVPGRSRETVALAGQWLAERLGRPVVVPDGALVAGVGGRSLFVDSAPGSGWVKCQPGRPPVSAGSRFPRPRWDSAVLPAAFSTSAHFVAEPMPAGLWVRPAGHDVDWQDSRRWLIKTVPCQADVLTVVLGTPRCPATVDDAATVWMRLPGELRSSVRFAQFGDSSSGLMAIGRELADLLNTTVACFTGLPVGLALPPAVFTVGFDGQLGWNVFAREVAYEPYSSATGRAAVLLSHRRPLPGIEEVEPAVYQYAPDAVIEVVQSGLWVRSPQAAAHAEAVRATRLVPGANRVVFDEPDGAGATRLKRLADDVAAQLDPHTRRMTEVVSVSALLTGLPAVSSSRQYAVAATAVRRRSPAVADGLPALTEKPRTQVLGGTVAGQLRPTPSGTMLSHATDVLQSSSEVSPATGAPRKPDLPEPNTTAMSVTAAEPALAGPAAYRATGATSWIGGVRLQRAPRIETSALTTGELTDERAWLRDDLGARYAAVATSVARVLSGQVGFEDILARTGDDIVTDMVAVRRYLSWDGDGVDAALRTGAAGPHVSFARCVVAGLRRLPVHRGPAVFTASPTSSELRLLRAHPTLTEWGFLHALSEPCADAEGTFDVLVWSVTARLTALLEPDAGQTEGRAVFLPGTRFRILIVIEPSGRTRGQILLRELAAGESDGDGQVDAELTSVDERAVTSLHRQAELWAREHPRKRMGETGSGRFGALPGLVTMKQPR